MIKVWFLVSALTVGPPPVMAVQQATFGDAYTLEEECLTHGGNLIEEGKATAFACISGWAKK